VSKSKTRMVIIVANDWVSQMKVNFYANLRRIVGQKTVEIPLADPATVRQLLEQLKLRYPQAYDQFVDQNGDLYPHSHLFINGRDLPYLNGLDTRLSDQDNADIFPPGHF
jgi:molybdopterin synthase sulfur carrier subunit